MSRVCRQPPESLEKAAVQPAIPLLKPPRLGLTEATLTQPLPVFNLEYAQLVAEPEQEVRRVCDFLGLPFDPATRSRCIDDVRRYGRPRRTVIDLEA